MCIWSVMTAIIPIALILTFIHYFAPNFKLILYMSNFSDKMFYAFFAICSLLSAGIWGLFLGPKLLDKTKTKSLSAAAFIGFEITLFSLFTLLGMYVVLMLTLQILHSGFNLDAVVLGIIYWLMISFAGVILFGWIIAPFGIIAALILYKIVLSDH